MKVAHWAVLLAENLVVHLDDSMVAKKAGCWVAQMVDNLAVSMVDWLVYLKVASLVGN